MRGCLEFSTQLFRPLNDDAPGGKTAVQLVDVIDWSGLLRAFKQSYFSHSVASQRSKF